MMYTFDLDYSPRTDWAKQGHTDFIKWIRHFGTMDGGLVTNGPLTLEKDVFTLDGRGPLECENYDNRVKCFLDPRVTQRVYVEIHDESLVEFAKIARKDLGV